MMDIATLGIKVDSRAVKDADKDLTDLSKTAGNTEKSTGKLSQTFAGMTATVITLAGAITSAYVASLAKAINTAEKFERLQLRTEALIKATGFSAGMTAKEIRAFSEELALSTLASVEGVEVAAQKLMTFKSVTGDVFREALRLSQDLAATGFGTLEQNAVQLGKALESPTEGISALTRVGVTFNDQQKEQIKLLEESGKKAEAQRIVLAALEGQVGGAGAGEAGGLSGSYDTLAQRIEKFLENVGNAGPINAAKIAIDSLAKSIENLNRLLFDTDQEKVNKLLGERMKLERSLLADPDNDYTKLRVIGINQEIAALQKKFEVENHQRRLAGEAAGSTVNAPAGGKTGGRTGGARASSRAAYEALELSAAQEAVISAHKEGLRVTEQMRTPLEKLTDTYASLNNLVGLGTISQETYNRAISAAQAEFDKATGAADAWNDSMAETQSTASNLETALINSFDAAGDAIAKFATGGKVSVGDMVQSMIADFIRLEARMQMMAMYKSVGGLGGLFSSLFGGGNVDTSFTTGLGSAAGMDYAAMSFDGGGYTGNGYRSGGVDGKGGFPAILHPNETVVDHSKGQSMGATVNIYNAPPGTTTRTSNRNGREFVEVFIAHLAKDDVMSKAIQSTFNLSRTGK
jgi:lambda family phage tail tape measure protein